LVAKLFCLSVVDDTVVCRGLHHHHHHHQLYLSVFVFLSLWVVAVVKIGEFGKDDVENAIFLTM
jgi:hypothetical protein